MENKFVKRFIGMGIIFLFILILSTLAMAVPNSLNVQGKLVNASGGVLIGTYDFTLRIYDSYTGGSLLYQTTSTQTTDARGVYDIVMENIDLPFDIPYYLAIRIDTDAEMQPRINLTSTPYTFRANISEGLRSDVSYTMVNLNATGNVDITGTLYAAGTITFPFLASCDTIDTDASGILSCGIDASGDLSSVINITSIFGGEVSGTYDNLIISNTALDDQYILRENASLIQSGNISFVTSQSVGGEVSGTIGNIIISNTALDDQYQRLLEAYNRGNLSSDLLLGTLNAGFSTVTVVNLLLDYHNITNIPTCSGNDKLTFNGNDLTCTADQDTGETSADDWNFANNDTLVLDNSTIIRTTNLQTALSNGTNANFVQVSAVSLLLDYHNITNIPTCSGSDKLTFNGNDLSCSIDNSVGGGAVLGSGNAGNLTYWTSANTLGNSTLFQSGGNIGIGTSSPEVPLHVDGKAKIGGDVPSVDFQLEILSATNSQIVWGAAGQTYGSISNNQIQSFSPHNLELGTTSQGSLIFLNDSTGNIGIGTPAPAEKLVVIGNVNISGTLNVSGRVSFSNLANCDTIDTDAAGVLTCGTDDSIGGGAVLGSGNAGNITYWDGANTLGNSTLYQSSGKIGIGTTTPGATLDVQGQIRSIHSSPQTGLENFPFYSRAGNPGYAMFDTGAANGWVWTAVVDGSMKLSTMVEGVGTINEKFRITADGKVGIGTPAPTEKLTIVGNISINDSSGDNENIFIDTTNDVISFTGENGSVYQPVYGSDDGLVVYIPFNTPNGSIQYDRSPYGNDGTPYNNTLCNISIGKYGTGCSFDGDGDYIFVPNSDTYNISDDLTMSAWVKFADVDGGKQSIFGNKQSGGFGLRLNHDVDGSRRVDATLDYFDGVTTSTHRTYSITLMENDRWYHIVGVKDGSDLFLYINGRLENVTHNVNLSDTEFGLYIGGDPGGTTPPGILNYDFNGSIDEVMIYKRALTPEEVRTHYLRGSGYGASGAITADRFRVVNTTGGRILEVNTSGFAVHTGGSERLKIDSSGNVGIGTSSPTDRLHVVGQTVLDGNLRFVGADGRSVQTYFDNLTFESDIDNNAGGDLFVWRGNAGVKYMMMDDVGNVGIGTGSPGSKLHIIGTINVTQQTTLNNVVIMDATINTTNNQDLILSSEGGNVIIQLG